MSTKADTNDLDLKNYKVLHHNYFTYSYVTSRNGNKISIAYNDGLDCIVSSINPVFRIKDENLLLPRFLMMFFNRGEFDRYARFNSWGSARETFTWEDMCDIELNVPPIEIQRKYVDIYEGLLANLKSYGVKLEDLKLVCDGYIENLKDKYESEEIGKYLEEVNERNEGRFSLFQGVDVSLNFINAKRVAEDSFSGKVVHNGEFAFNKVMKANCTKLPIALRRGETCVISGSYSVFKIVKPAHLLNDYLMLWLSRAETQRYAGFVSFGTTRDIFDFSNLSSIKIPIPPLDIQKSIVDVFNVYNERKEFIERIKQIIGNICPVLVKGAIEEGKRGVSSCQS